MRLEERLAERREQPFEEWVRDAFVLIDLDNALIFQNAQWEAVRQRVRKAPHDPRVLAHAFRNAVPILIAVAVRGLEWLPSYNHNDAIVRIKARPSRGFSYEDYDAVRERVELNPAIPYALNEGLQSSEPIKALVFTRNMEGVYNHIFTKSHANNRNRHLLEDEIAIDGMRYRLSFANPDVQPYRAALKNREEISHLDVLAAMNLDVRVAGNEFLTDSLGRFTGEIVLGKNGQAFLRYVGYPMGEAPIISKGSKLWVYRNGLPTEGERTTILSIADNEEERNYRGSPGVHIINLENANQTMIEGAIRQISGYRNPSVSPR